MIQRKGPSGKASSDVVIVVDSLANLRLIKGRPSTVFVEGDGFWDWNPASIVADTGNASTTAVEVGDEDVGRYERSLTLRVNGSAFSGLEFPAASVSGTGNVRRIKTTITAPNWAALSTIAVQVGDVVDLVCHTSANDGGGGTFDVVDNTGGSYVADGGTIATNGALAIVRREADPYLVKARWFGVYAGRTDNAPNINAAIDYMQNGGALDLRGRGTLYVSDSVNLLARQFITIHGSNTTIWTRTGSNFTGKAVVNAFGTSYLVINDLRVYSTLATNVPACGLAIGRTATHQGGAVTINGGYYYGRYTGAPLYNMCAENSGYYNASFEGIECAGMLDASDDPLSLSGGGYAISNFGKQITNCVIASTGNGSTAIAKFQGRSYSVFVDGGFIHSNTTAVDGFAFELGTISNDPVNDQAHTVSIRNVRSEQAAGWRIAHITKYTSGFTFDQPNTSSGGAALIELSTTNARLVNSSIRVPKIGGAGCPVLKLNGAAGVGIVSYSDILVGSPGMIECVSGTVVTCNIRSLSGYPVIGAGRVEAADYGNLLTVHGITGAKSYTENGARRRFWKTITGATPSVGGWELFKTDQTAATDVTNFADGSSGQRITIRELDGLSTFKHGATIQNKSGADVTLAIGATIEYVLDGTVWVEV